MAEYQFLEQGRFQIKGYNKAKPFASFLPGIAGVNGTPMWVFYVNRGQGIASFGVQDKDHGIMEFFPAHKAYQLTPTQGFRTFIKWRKEGAQGYWEPFAGRGRQSLEEEMILSPNGLELHSQDEASGLEVRVQYFTMPGEWDAALVRQVSILNRGDDSVELELLDGMPAVLPHGLSNGGYKEVGNTLKAWMDVYNLENGIPFYRVRASTADTAEVEEVTAGHFYMSFVAAAEGAGVTWLEPVVDAELVFGRNTAMLEPDTFVSEGLDWIAQQPVVTANKVPCGFSPVKRLLPGGGSLELVTLVGHTSKLERINSRKSLWGSLEFIEGKRVEAERLAQELTEPVWMASGVERFDGYTRQCFLDNVLRGGYPLLLGREGEGQKAVYHVYSRKHGDLERDYNFFSLQPSVYSQGNGNFRDVNQNRRMDVFFEPEVGTFNIKLFMNLIQTDGYNPLVVKGSQFVMEPEVAAGLKLPMVEERWRDTLRKQLVKPYTPGGLLQFMFDRGITLAGVTAAEFINEIVGVSRQETDAVFGEGYWSDHWTYNLDQIEAYLAIYPDRLEELLLEDRSYKYYDSPAYVLPRSRKVVAVGTVRTVGAVGAIEGKVRQYGAVREDHKKEELLASRQEAAHWVRLEYGLGEVYYTNLYEKLVVLGLLKFATLDPEGLGVEMEAGKPGWNDSLNGLPGLFGSSLNETAELLRLVNFLLEQHRKLEGELEVVKLPTEVTQLLRKVEGLLDLVLCKSVDAFQYWDQVSTAREEYRERVFYGLSGEFATLPRMEIRLFLEKCKVKLEAGLDRAKKLGDGLYPTYFYYEAESIEALLDECQQPLLDPKGRPYVRVTGFRRKELPPFLEGAVRTMKVLDSLEDKRSLYRKVKESGIYDRKLKMYKVNVSLSGQPMELGRTTAFTPGWLENESVFLHMEYKYLLELLKAGLVEEFMEDMRNALVPFLEPSVYGRSTLENSSFIASSANPDPSLHGTGFVARLSGSTVEFLQMWQIMMTGATPFRWKGGGGLELVLQPVLPGWLFREDGLLRCRFLGSVEVTYGNPKRLNTYGEGAVIPSAAVLTYENGTVVRVSGGVIQEPYASDVRAKRVKGLQVVLS